jgi:hypothetical protein
MNKKLTFLVMLICVLTLGLVFVSCDDGSDSSKKIPSDLIGRWTAPSDRFDIYQSSVQWNGAFAWEVKSVSKINNDNTRTKDEYPSGYRIVCKGLTSDMTYNLFLNSDKTAFVYGTRTDRFVKQ